MLVYRGFSHAAPGPTVLTIGNFDGIHQGHRALLGRLTASAASAQLLPAVLTFEPHPREYFAPESAPARLSTLREKLELIADEGVAVTWVCRFNARFAALSADEFIARVLVDALRVKHLIIGDDFCFGADRTGDKATGEYRMHTSLQYANLFDRDHTASIQYTTSPGHADKVKTWVGAYRVPFYALGDSLDVFAAWSDIDSSDAVTQVSDVQLTGKGSIFGLRYTKNLPQLGLWTQKLVGGIDYRRYKNDIRLGPTPYKSDYAALPLSLTWGVSRSDERLTLDASAGIIRNLPWVGLSGQSDYDQG